MAERHEVLISIKSDEDKLKQIKVLIEAGHTDAFVAKFLKVNVGTFRAFIKRYPDLESKVKEWKDAADDNVEKALYDKAIGYSMPETKVFCYEGSIVEHETTKHFPPDYSSGSLWLRNRRREDWKDIKDMSTKADLTVKGQLHVGQPELNDRLEQLGEAIETTAREIIQDEELEEMLG